jgi:CBS domain containing-hemolysin-like protein
MELGHIPSEGEQFDFKQLKFEIVEMNNFKIETVRVTKLHPAEDEVGREADPR